MGTPLHSPKTGSTNSSRSYEENGAQKSGNFGLTATGCAGPYTWSVQSGTLPGGFSLSSGGVISGTPTVGGSFNFTVGVSGSGCFGGEATFTLDIGPWITTSSPLPTGAVGASYSQTLSAAAGSPPYTWSAAPGRLPAGLSLSSTGVISGTPTAAGTSTFGVRLTDSASATASQAFSLTVNPPPSQLSIQYLFTASGTASVKLIVPTFITADVYVAASALASCTYLQPYTCAYVSVLPSGPDSGGHYFELDVTAQSGTTSAVGGFWYFQDGAFSSIGEYGSVEGATSATLSVSYVPTPDYPPVTLFTSPPSPVITTTSLLTGGQAGVAYSQKLGGALGHPPYTWSVAPGTLPAGLSLSSTGVISGTPTTAGTSTFGITVTDSSYNTASQTFSLTVNPPALLAIVTTSPLPSGVAGTVYSQTLTASGGVPPYIWSRTNGTLPAGLALSSTGVISGTPAMTGTSTFGIAVTDSTSATATQTFSLTVNLLPPLTITTASPLPSGVAGAVYSQTLTASGGVPPYSWSRTTGTLPAGLALSSAGAISGTPSAAGTSTFGITVTDSASNTTTQTFSLTVSPAPLLISTTSNLPSGVAGTAYAQTLTATGGIPPYTWAIASGPLPALLTLSAGGVIGGIPAEAGVSTFSVIVYDSGQHSATQTFTLTITLVALTVVTPSTLASGVVGASYSQTLAATGGIPPYTWSVTSGTWPPGLALSAGGVISGTPAAAGAYSFTVQAKDGGSETATQTFALTVAAAGTLTRVGVISQIAAGGGWDTTIWLVNRLTASVQTSIVFQAL